MSNRNAEKIKRRRKNLNKNQDDNSQLNDKHFFSFVYWGIIFIICILGLIIYLSFKYDSVSEWIIPIGSLLLTLFLLSILIIPKLYVQSLQAYSDNSFDKQKEKLKLEDDTRKTVAQIIGGVVLLGGLIFTYNTFRLQQDTYRLQQEGQFTDRFTKAITQIGDEKLEVRLGGLYALERIEKDSPKDHSTIMEILSAYIREKSKTQENEFEDKPLDKKLSEEGVNSFSLVRPETDIRAAITIINRRELKNDNSELTFDLIGANLKFMSLKNANFISTNFSSANLLYADFESSNLSKSGFVRTNLSFTNLSKTNLSNAVFQFTNLTATNFANANLTNASFFMADFKSTVFSSATLKNVEFRGANLSSTKLTFEQLSEAIINETTKLPSDLENRKDELIEISKKNLEEKKKELNEK